jgi:hypothetical protein
MGQKQASLGQDVAATLILLQEASQGLATGAAVGVGAVVIGYSDEHTAITDEITAASVMFTVAKH